MYDDSENANSSSSARTANAVAGWQKLSEERGQQLAEARSRNEELGATLAELSERLQTLEAQAQSGAPERAPHIVDTNNPGRPMRNTAIRPDGMPSEFPDWWKNVVGQSPIKQR